MAGVAAVLVFAGCGSASANVPPSSSSLGTHLTARQAGARLRPLGCRIAPDTVKPDGPESSPKPQVRLACTVRGDLVQVWGYANTGQVQRLLQQFKATKPIDCQDMHASLPQGQAAVFGNAWMATALRVATVKKMAPFLPGRYAKVC